jgi:hypothetical protein
MLLLEQLKTQVLHGLFRAEGHWRCRSLGSVAHDGLHTAERGVGCWIRVNAGIVENLLLHKLVLSLQLLNLVLQVLAHRLSGRLAACGALLEGGLL